MQPLYPWQQRLWQQMMQAWQQQRLPHALLLAGAAGMGKAVFANCLAETLLCLQPQSQQACGHCKACQLLKAKTHPDLNWVKPAEGKKQIAIDQIRELIQFCGLTPTYGTYQIVIIEPAELMNHYAENSLLKLLEEPPPDTLIFLISHQPMALLATIRSRCQRLDFNRPPTEMLVNWLQTQLPSGQNIPLLLNLSSHAPLAAKQLADSGGLEKRKTLFESLIQLYGGKTDPVKIAEGWLQLDNPLQTMAWLISITMDCIRYSSTQQPHFLTNQDYIHIIQRLNQQFTQQQFFSLLDAQRDTYRLLLSTANIKPQGLLESVAISWLSLSNFQNHSQAR